jgi:hypothetical protein
LGNLWKKIHFYDKKGNEFKVDQVMEKIETLEEEEEEEEDEDESVSAEELAKNIPQKINLGLLDTDQVRVLVSIPTLIQVIQNRLVAS